MCVPVRWRREKQERQREMERANRPEGATEVGTRQCGLLSSGSEDRFRLRTGLSLLHDRGWAVKDFRMWTRTKSVGLCFFTRKKGKFPKGEGVANPKPNWNKAASRLYIKRSKSSQGREREESPT